MRRTCVSALPAQGTAVQEEEEEESGSNPFESKPGELRSPLMGQDASKTPAHPAPAQVPGDTGRQAAGNPRQGHRSSRDSSEPFQGGKKLLRRGDRTGMGSCGGL